MLVKFVRMFLFIYWGEKQVCFSQHVWCSLWGVHLPFRHRCVCGTIEDAVHTNGSSMATMTKQWISVLNSVTQLHNIVECFLEFSLLFWTPYNVNKLYIALQNQFDPKSVKHYLEFLVFKKACLL